MDTESRRYNLSSVRVLDWSNMTEREKAQQALATYGVTVPDLTIWYHDVMAAMYPSV